LFRNRALGRPADDAFTDDPADLSGSLLDHAATIMGALRLSADDLAALATGPRAVLADTTLDLWNLSTLYRYALLAQGLQLSVLDLLRARVLLGDPFGNPTPTTAGSPAATAEFVRRVDAIRVSGFDLPLLAYLL